jgi:DNA-binding IclR family transcriptional regulator
VNKATVDTKPTQTVERALSLLDVLGRADHALSLTEIAQQAGIHISTSLRLLRTLAMTGFVERGAVKGQYRLGSKIFTLAHALERQIDLRSLARPILQGVTAATNEMSSVAVLDGSEVMLLERAISRNELGFLAGPGSRGPLYCTAAGKALLAHADPELIERILSGPLPPRTPTTITTPEALWAELARVRAQGYAIDQCEREPGLFGVATPVRDVSNRVIAVLSVSGPAERINTPALPQTIATIREAAAVLSAKLGWVDPAQNGW